MNLKVGSELFKKELNLIKDETLKEIIKGILDEDIHYDNFLNASSSTGKYHPSFDNTRYGNTNHSKAVVKLCKVLLYSREDLADYADLIYSAAILHDMWKYDGKSSHTIRIHAELAYNYLTNDITTDDQTMNDKLKTIAVIIKYHMGHWSFDKWFEEINALKPIIKDCVLIVHYADMIASRNFYEVENFSL